MKYFENEISDEVVENVYDKLGYGICADDVVASAETLADYDAAHRQWAECGAREEKQVAGFTVLIFSGAQSAKGMPRGDQVIVDFGPFRTVFAA